jgi:hypothetical protein
LDVGADDFDQIDSGFFGQAHGDFLLGGEVSDA